MICSLIIVIINDYSLFFNDNNNSVLKSYIDIFDFNVIIYFKIIRLLKNIENYLYNFKLSIK